MAQSDAGDEPPPSLKRGALSAILSVGTNGRRLEILRLLNICKSKIHRATVTETDVDYVGSITIDSDLMDRAGLVDGEMVHVWDVDNGERFETYAIPGERGSGNICVNGAAAHRVGLGHKVIIAAFCLTDEPVTRKVVLVDDNNRYVDSL